MTFVVDNLRLKELAIVAEQNRPIYDDFINYLQQHGYPSLHAFVTEQSETRGEQVILNYLDRPLPNGVVLLDGIARPYQPDKAKWLLLGWIFRDAPEQRLRPMLSSMPRQSSIEKKAYVLNKLRIYISSIFKEPQRWDWTPVSEVIIDRLEGSRRAIKGTLFEVIVRRNLKKILEESGIELDISNSEIRLEGETYDVRVSGSKGQILMPVKTRETMGGGHALLFTRDIHKSISVAHNAGFECIPIVIAESWSGNLSSLTCKDHIFININPNQVTEVEPKLEKELEKRIQSFREIV